MAKTGRIQLCSTESLPNRKRIAAQMTIKKRNTRSTIAYVGACWLDQRYDQFLPNWADMKKFCLPGCVGTSRCLARRHVQPDSTWKSADYISEPVSHHISQTGTSQHQARYRQPKGRGRSARRSQSFSIGSLSIGRWQTPVSSVYPTPTRQSRRSAECLAQRML